MSLKQQITDDMKAAMKAGEKERLGVIRLILAALKQREALKLQHDAAMASANMVVVSEPVVVKRGKVALGCRNLVCRYDELKVSGKPHERPAQDVKGGGN